MKISYNWLKNYIDIQLQPEEVAKILTNTGLEVESVEKIQKVKGGLEGLVIGKVLSKSAHPNADRLSITTVDVGTENPLQIVCGASNVAAGQKVVVALVGTTLFKGDESFQIKSSKIRGELSEGMICAEDEINLGNSHDGIMVLSDDAKIGMLAKEYFNIEDDYVFEIGLTPNRTDAMCHIGVARDLAAVLNLESPTTIHLPDTKKITVQNNSLSISVEVLDNERCPRYSGITVSGVTVKDSPEWLKNKLLAIGLKPVNNIVDVTNFVLHETGQPLHAFDANKIHGNKVIVKTLDENTSFTTLDNKARKLSQNDLMICNSAEPMCIAGVFGGADSGVSLTTQNIFLESAYFNSVSVRKTAKFHGLNTDASFRYERGADPNITIYALQRAVLLIQEVAGGFVSSDVIDIYPKPITDHIVNFSYQNCEKMLGEKIQPETIKKIIQSLDIKIVNESIEELTLQVPPFKADVKREIDVIEEILRIYGYNKIEIPTVMKSALVFHQKSDHEVTSKISSLLVSLGFNEMLSNSLTKSSYYHNSNEVVELINPLSNDLNVLRSTMLFDGLETVEFNQNRKLSDIKLFEFGKTYQFKNGYYEEQHCLGVFISGHLQQENWNIKNNPKVDFYFLKKIVNSILNRIGFELSNFENHTIEHSNFEYGLSYQNKSKEIVIFGKVNPLLQKQFDIANEVYFAQFNIDALVSNLSSSAIKYKEICKFPAVRRDLALLIDKSVHYSQLEKLAFKLEKKLLKEVSLFDVYEGEKLEVGKKSYALSFTFQDDEKTLTDQFIDNTMDKLIQGFATEFGAKLR